MVSRRHRLGKQYSTSPSRSDPTTSSVIGASKTATNMKSSSSTKERKRRKFKLFRRKQSAVSEINNASTTERDGASEKREGLLTSSNSHEESLLKAFQQQTTILPIHRPPVTVKTDHDTTSTTTDSIVGGALLQLPPAPPAGGALAKQSNQSSSTIRTVNQTTICSPVSMLDGSFFEGVCGSEPPTWLEEEEERNFRLSQLPDDPSVQESIECVFSPKERQQQVRLQGESKDEDVGFVGDNANSSSPFQLTSPSVSQQCLMRNRSLANLPEQFKQEALSMSPRKAPRPTPAATAALQPESSCKLHQEYDSDDDIPSTVDEEDHAAAAAVSTPPTTTTTSTQPPPTACICSSQCMPQTDPERWPQRPLLMRPTPNGGTVVRGIRYSSHDRTNYIWHAQTSPLTWPQALQAQWKKEQNRDCNGETNDNSATASRSSNNVIMCEHCMVLPINNGTELEGESLVTDFESDLFEGSILVRLKDSKGTTCPGRQQEKGYFHGVHRRYQVVVRGKFKKEIAWTECFAGFQLERPAGKLPPKWIVNGALNLVRFFAPQLQTKLHGPNPLSMTPLGSTPQSLIVKGEDDCKMDVTMEIPQSEPVDANETLTGLVSTAESTMQRARFRKKCFDKLFTAKSVELKTDTSKVYTFEFLQHLLSFDDFTIELGSMIGSIHLQNILNGQPLQIMASHKYPVPLKDGSNAVQNRLWCFDIWHEMLIADARRYEASLASGTTTTESQ